MEIKACMGNPSNRSKCEKCKRLPRTPFDESDAPSWYEWKKMVTPCAGFVEVESK